MATRFEQKPEQKLTLPVLAVLLLLLFFLSLGLIAVFNPLWLEGALSLSEGWYSDLIANQNQSLPFPFLLGFAFVGGILGSISPCILAMLPMNLSYIGTLKIESRTDAVRKAGAFVLGVVLITSLFGLVSGFAQAVMVAYKGWLFVSVAGIVMIMAAVMLEWIHLPLPRVISRIPSAGPFVVGMAFALISSPCASPVLFGILALAATSDNLILSVATMAVYGFGYTLLIFLASLFTGLSKQVGFLKYHGAIITRISAAVLFLGGLWALTEGLRWFFVG
jgi:cytochrome c-type biogenesis protein